MIIGLTGKLCSGKGVLAEYLKQRGFAYYSLSDIIRKEAESLGMPKTRENLIFLGNKLRNEGGNGVLAEKIVSMLQGEDIIIDSIRNSAEVEALRERLESFTLVGVDSLDEVRFKRSLERKGRNEDPKTISELKKICEDEDSDNGQQVGKCMSLADCVVINNGNLQQLYTKTEKMLHDLNFKLGKPQRIGKADYYLTIAEAVLKRATCLRRRYGAVIVKDDHILSTGYCGASRGLKNCCDIGVCPRKEMNVPPGERYELCRSVHAEDNAIINAARAGVSILGADIYVAGEDSETNEPVIGKPCKMCARKIVNTGIKNVIVKDEGEILKISVEELSRDNI